MEILVMKKDEIEIVEGDTAKKIKEPVDKACPACGNPGGMIKCSKCDWSVEQMEPDFGGSSRDPVSAIMHARLSFSDIKKENDDLKKKTDPLIANNRKFSELVESMEEEIKRLRTEAGKKYVYRYEQGGWGQINKIDREKLHLKKEVTVDDINRQLNEIMRILKKYKK